MMEILHLEMDVQVHVKLRMDLLAVMFPCLLFALEFVEMGKGLLGKPVMMESLMIT